MLPRPGRCFCKYCWHQSNVHARFRKETRADTHRGSCGLDWVAYFSFFLLLVSPPITYASVWIISISLILSFLCPWFLSRKEQQLIPELPTFSTIACEQTSQLCLHLLSLRIHLPSELPFVTSKEKTQRFHWMQCLIVIKYILIKFMWGIQMHIQGIKKIYPPKTMWE